jgi:hypothetical protein
MESIQPTRLEDLLGLVFLTAIRSCWKIRYKIQLNCICPGQTRS